MSIAGERTPNSKHCGLGLSWKAGDIDKHHTSSMLSFAGFSNDTSFLFEYL
jgi:hypothetical protein